MQQDKRDYTNRKRKLHFEISKAPPSVPQTPTFFSKFFSTMQLDSFFSEHEINFSNIKKHLCCLNKPSELVEHANVNNFTTVIVEAESKTKPQAEDEEPVNISFTTDEEIDHIELDLMEEEVSEEEDENDK